MLSKALEPDAAGAGGRHRRRLVRAPGQVGDQVGPGRDAARPHARQVTGEHLDERVPPATVRQPGAAEVAVELAALEEVCERELLETPRRWA
jgi:hypothetical protein